MDDQSGGLFDGWWGWLVEQVFASLSYASGLVDIVAGFAARGVAPREFRGLMFMMATVVVWVFLFAVVASIVIACCFYCCASNKHKTKQDQKDTE